MSIGVSGSIGFPDSARRSAQPLATKLTSVSQAEGAAAAADETRATTEPSRSPAPEWPGFASFEGRCAGPAVVLCDPLDTARARGVGIDNTTPCATLPDALDNSRCRYRSWRWGRVSKLVGTNSNPHPPELDTGIKASGTGSLKFTIPTRSDANDSGFLQVNFTPDNSVQFGEGETFFVQWRQRFSRDMLFDKAGKRRRYAVTSGHGGFKIIIINAGDHPDLTYPVSSCTRQHIVFNNGGQRGEILGYHSCGWYKGFMAYHGLHPGSGSGQFDRQPGGENRCWRLHPDTGAKLDEAWPDCVMYLPDDWMTFQVQVTVGRWADKSKDPARSSNVRLWVAREGEKSRLVIDHNLNLRRPKKPFMKYGKVWLLPYHTNKDPVENHSEAYTWYDDLIVSRARIPDPL